MQKSSGTTLVIKPDERFVQLCSFHEAALARLSAAADVGERLGSMTTQVAQTIRDVAKGIYDVAQAEQQGASAGISAATAAKEAEKHEKHLQRIGSSEEEEDEAAAAFAAHTSAQKAKESQNEIDAMFDTSCDDPFHNAAMPADQGRKETKQEESHSTSGLSASLEEVSKLLGGISNRLHDQTSSAKTVLYNPMRVEQQKEAELEAANQRRQELINSAQRAHAQVQRNKQAYASLRQKGDAGEKSQVSVRYLSKLDANTLRSLRCSSFDRPQRKPFEPQKKSLHPDNDK